MIDLNYAHDQLIGRHNTVRYETAIARVSLCKDKGLYNVILRDKVYQKTRKQSFKTIQGALASADMLRSFYL